MFVLALVAVTGLFAVGHAVVKRVVSHDVFLASVISVMAPKNVPIVVSSYPIPSALAMDIHVRNEVIGQNFFDHLLRSLSFADHRIWRPVQGLDIGARNPIASVYPSRENSSGYLFCGGWGGIAKRVRPRESQHGLRAFVVETNDKIFGHESRSLSMLRIGDLSGCSLSSNLGGIGCANVGIHHKSGKYGVDTKDYETTNLYGESWFSEFLPEFIEKFLKIVVALFFAFLFAAAGFIHIQLSSTRRSSRSVLVYLGVGFGLLGLSFLCSFYIVLQIAQAS